jgi:hypothetical protein
VRSSFEEFIETNLMVQSEFNLIFWFMSYNIFFVKQVGPALHVTSLLSLPPARTRLRTRGPVRHVPDDAEIPDVCLSACIAQEVAYLVRHFFPVNAFSRSFTACAAVSLRS